MSVGRRIIDPYGRDGVGRIIKRGDLGWIEHLPPNARRFMPINTATTQTSFAWGDPGTESGHAINTPEVDLALAEDGNGDQDHFLRFELDQTVTNADANLTRIYRLQRNYSPLGFPDGYATCPTSGAAEPVIS